MADEARVISIAEIAKLKRMALNIQESALANGYTQEELVNCVLAMAGEFISQLPPKMQALALDEILYVAGLKESPIKRFN